jgi:hypothetical protein
MAHRKDVSSLSNAQLTQLRTLLDQFIIKSTNNPVAEHQAAGIDMSLMIHGMGFLAWRQHFIAELETWLVSNGDAKCVPLPYWNPAKPIPAQLNKNNTNVNMPLPTNPRPAALKQINSYTVLNNRAIPYHNAVHNGLRGQMPNPETSPSDRFSGHFTRSWLRCTSGGVGSNSSRRHSLIGTLASDGPNQ